MHSFLIPIDPGGIDMRYSDEERAEAVALLEAEGYPGKKGALMAVAERLGIPHPTIRRWYLQVQNPPPYQMVREKRRELSELFRDEIYAIIGVLPERRDEAGYRELVTALGILFDKTRLIDGQATERVEVSLDDKREDLERRIARITAGRGKEGVHSESD